MPKPPKKNRIMLDLETLGRRAGCVILSIGACRFDAGRIGDKFYRVVWQKSCIQLNLGADPSTLEWWKKQSEPACTVLKLSLNKKTSLALPIALRDFALFCRQDGYLNPVVWGNGASFDQPILEDCYARAQVTLPWGAFDSRCYRTVKNMAAAKEVKMKRSGTYHNALDDAINQARHLMAIEKKLGVSFG